DHLPTLANLGTAYWKLKRLDKSTPIMEELVSLSEKIRGRTHPETLRDIANLGVNYRDAGRLEKAIPLLKEAYDARQTSPYLGHVGTELLIAYVRAGKAAEGVALAKANLAEARQSLPAASPRLGTALATNGNFLLELKAWADAEPILRE